MKNTIKKLTIGAAGMALMLSLVGIPVSAQKTTDAKEIRKQQKEGRKDVREATDVLRKIMNVPDKAIPRELLEKAEAIGIFPSVVKAGFIVGGRGGDGVVARRTTNGWSAPVFYNIGGASFGAQIGVEKTDYIMLFMNEGALRELLNDKLAFEGNLSFAAGPIGRTVGAATNATLDSGILIWSRNKGAFVGASIGGAVLAADNSKNQAFYKMNAGEILEKPESVGLTNISVDLRGFTDIIKFYAK
jgi:lipid-binding SYLF domain-containing protein